MLQTYKSVFYGVVFLCILYSRGFFGAQLRWFIAYLVPVFCFYAFPKVLDTSSLQGNTAPGAKGAIATSVGVDEDTVNYKPDCSGKPTAQRGLEMKSRTGGRHWQSTFISKKQLSLQC